mmetsp:Transcript_4004/g.7721  ORF Transcript_4004/g.7721 Transcript_4004/m.7721 type:complete len:135 (+) Transcript_4004:96-500(+)
MMMELGFVGGVPLGGCRRTGGVLVAGRRGNGRVRSTVVSGRVRMGLFGLGMGEIGVIAVVAALIFGPSKISELGKSAGGMAGSIKKATSEFQEALQESLEEADREIAAKKAATEEVGEGEDGKKKVVESIEGKP